jgi:protein O-mannosyl-transferase
MALFSKTFKEKFLLPFFTLLFLGFLLYANTLHGDFVSDDKTFVSTNSAIRDLGNLRAIWVSFNTRFLTGLTFALNYRFGKLNVVGYHFVNILLHVIASFLVFRFIDLTFETPCLKDTPLAKKSWFIAFFASLVFLTHPIQTQGVAYITQRFVSMSTAFYLLTLIFYILARLRSRRIYYMASISTLIIGLFCKENIITVPVTIGVYEFFFFKAEGRKWWQRLSSIGPFFLSWAFALMILALDSPGATMGLKTQMIGRGIDWNYFFTEINVLRTYLRLFILPVHQIHEYDYPRAHGFWEPATVYSFCLLAALLGLAYYLFKKNRLLSFCILWFFITTSVEFMVVSIVNRSLIFEHWLYLPMVGFSCFLSVTIYSVFRDQKRMMGAVGLLIALLALASYERNKIWQEELYFWQDSVKKSPGRPAVHFALGRVWEGLGQDDLAMQEYTKALAINPQLDQALNNMASIYLKKGDHARTKELLQRTVSINPDFAEAYNNIAYLHYLEGDYGQAIRFYRESIKRQGPYPMGYFYLGACYLELGRIREAKENLQEAFELHVKRDEPEKAKEVKLFLEGIPEAR